MQSVNYLTFDEVGITIAVISAALAFVVLVWNAVKAIHDWRLMAKKPTAERIENHEQRITHLETCCEEVRGKLDSDYQFRQDNIEMNRLMLRAIKQMLRHEIDGNDREGLSEVQDEIDKYLVGHVQ